MPHPNQVPRGQPPPGQGLTGPYIPINAVIPQATIFLPALNSEYEIPEIPNVMTKKTIKTTCVDVCQRDKIQFQQAKMMKVNTGRDLVRVYHMRQIGECPNNKGCHPEWKKRKRSGESINLSQMQHEQEENMTQKMTQRHYNQPKQQNKNLKIGLEDIVIDHYHNAAREKSMTNLTKEANQENDQDQKVIQDRETIKFREKLEWTSIETRMGMKPEAN
ncbi:MAG: hypothetical protein EZS28_032943 [Streblomastix strix]|uniref:Uncharacterized protein n=1 Tax=Streblomastix strix TaxID=222440 RepID=A0A5J4UNH5_9EUKA|nr:MAG: hypothetical protein EZS28_032943 [Streblomastix strix]